MNLDSVRLLTRDIWGNLDTLETAIVMEDRVEIAKALERIQDAARVAGIELWEAEEHA